MSLRLPCPAALCWLAGLSALPALAVGEPSVVAAHAAKAPIAEVVRDGGAGTSNDQRYIVTFRVTPSAAAKAVVEAAANAVKEAGGRVVRELPSVHAVAARLSEPAVRALRAQPDVERVEVDPRRYLAQAGPHWTDTVQGREVTPYGIAMVQADQLSDAAAGNRKVCIIDTGYDRGHDDLQDLDVTASPDAGTGDPFQDGYGHGTHVAGTIAGIGNGIGVRGVDPSERLKLHVVKVFGDFAEWAYSSDLIHALAECRAAGANVVSMSLAGFYPSVAEETAFADAYAAGVLSIAAAGNAGLFPEGAWYQYPASYPSVVSVAAVDASETVAPFSQHNDRVELAAPGVSVLSTLPHPYDYDRWDGTSMATPHVSGVAALLWSYNPGWSNVQVREALRQTAKDEGVAGRDDSYGWGVVQARSALEYLCGPGCVPPAPAPVPRSDCFVDTSRTDFDTGQATGLNLAASPGDVRLLSSGDPRPDQQATMLSGFGFLVTATSWRAQVFKAGVTGDLLAADLNLFFNGPFGTQPALTVSLRAASGGLPTGPDLASATLGGFNGAWWAPVTFPSPATLQAGAEYALVLRPVANPGAGAYYWSLNTADTYDEGAHVVSEDSGGSWAVPTGNDPYDHWDLAFRTLMRPAPPDAYGVGTLTSTLKDSVMAPGGTVRWGNLSWTATLPAGTSIRFQVAGSDSGAGPFDYVGPDGTAETSFGSSGASLAQFDGRRFLRYRVVLATSDPAATPVLHDVSTCFETVPPGGGGTLLRGSVVDRISGDPIAGATVAAATQSATTGAAGSFELGGLGPGTYNVSASAPGHASATVSGVQVLAGTGTRPVLLALGPPAACRTDTLQPSFERGAGSNVDVRATPGDVRLSRNSGLDQSQSTTGRGWGFNAWQLHAQTFTPASSGLLVAVEVLLGCSPCSGLDPDITVEVRNAGAGSPGDTVLATATIAGFSSASDQIYRATFANPPSLIAGKRYAFVLRLRSNRAMGWYVASGSWNVVLDPGATDQYAGGAHFVAYDAGALWNENADDLIFRTYMSAPPSFAAAGSLESTGKDAGSFPVGWTSLSWTADLPASTAVRFQVAASNSPSGPFAFVGPDGTASTFFDASAAALAQAGRGRYLKYKAFLVTANPSATPALHEVTACYEPLPRAAGSFFTVTPCRLLDTRQPGQGGSLASGASRALPVYGACSIPGTASSVAVNVTVTQATRGGHVVVYAGGATVPGTSTINFRPGQTRANNAVIRLGDAGDLGLSAAVGDGSVDVIVDVVGYFE